MALYKVVEPCVYAVDGKAVQHTSVGAVVELPGVVAARLGSAVEKVDADKPKTGKPAADDAVLSLKPEGNGV